MINIVTRMPQQCPMHIDHTSNVRIKQRPIRRVKLAFTLSRFLRNLVRGWGK